MSKIHYPLRLAAWAKKHNVTSEAMRDLSALMIYDPVPPPPQAGRTEAAVQSRQRITLAKLGFTLWRNNVGVLRDERGVPVRYGLANDNAELNKVIKSADLIGWRKLAIRQEHVGTQIAQFASIESKKGDWRFTGAGREAAQARWSEIITDAGGVAVISNADDAGLGDER